MDEGSLDSDGVRLHYIDWGGSGHPVVLLPGLGGTAHLFGSLAPRLAGSFRVLSLTRRGTGTSDVPDSGYELDTLVTDICNFLDAFEVDEAALVGHSFAGLEISRLAVLHPERVRALVYLDALDVTQEPAPDLAADPVWKAIRIVPTDEDLATPESYLAFQRARPDIGSIWCDAVEADRTADMTIDGIRDPRAARARQARVGPQLFAGLGGWHADYAAVHCPMLAVVPMGKSNPFLPATAAPDLRAAANRHYESVFLPRIERRTTRFLEEASCSQILELDTSNHTVFVACEDEVLHGIETFLGPDRSGTVRA